MDYERKNRNVTYFSDSCKMYLRHDFKHTCAYCGALEDVTSPFPEIAELNYEKDHFLPQNEKFPERHQYSNLFYACRKCNGKKDEVELPLNPCVDDIYSGNEPHVVFGTSTTNFGVSSSTPEGKKYIELLELNSRYHVSLREQQQEYLQASAEAKEILDKLRESQKLDESLLKAIEAAMYPKKNHDIVKYICGTSKFGLLFADTYHYLLSKGYICEIILENNELDMKVKIDNVQYWVQLLPLSDAEQCRIQVSKLKEWEKLGVPCGIIRYKPLNRAVYFYKIDFKNVDWERNVYSISSYTQL